jgi:multimeric flavodoxin WrbA
MNVLGISGTPRERGNSHILLEQSLLPFRENGWDVTILRLRNLTVKPCNACDYCRIHKSECNIDDDMRLFYDSFRKCKALIVASPVYSRNIFAQLMAVFDRHYAVNIERPLEGKVGGAIAVGAGEGDGSAITISAIYNWMH